jgi:hypothetical protein
MSRTIVINTVLAAVLAAGVGAAQTTPPTSGSQASSKSGQPAKGTQSQNVTLTGCVEADQAASGTSGSGTTGKSAASSAHYKLTNVTSTGSTGTSGTPAGTSGDVTLMGSNLKAHVGHKVQVTGRWDHSMSGSSASSRSGTAGSTGTTATGTSGTGASGDGQMLRVTSVKMISSSCSGQ